MVGEAGKDSYNRVRENKDCQILLMVDMSGAGPVKTASC